MIKEWIHVYVDRANEKLKRKGDGVEDPYVALKIVEFCGRGYT